MGDTQQHLLDALADKSDIELLLDDGRSIRVHSLKLAMASSVLSDLMDVMEEQIISSKRQRTVEGMHSLPTLKVGISFFALF